MSTTPITFLLGSGNRCGSTCLGAMHNALPDAAVEERRHALLAA